MKYTGSDIQVEKSQGLKESFFKVSDENVSHIFHILRNQLYSDKEAAVIREYVSNAVDAHKEIGLDKPVEITFPTAIESSFCVRDYGRGLTEEEIRDIYVSYGDSTKRSTNKAIGMLGLGAKSAFGYTDNFTIISWCNGKKNIYSAYIDETNCGKIALLSSSSSKENSGIEVKIPVKDYDRYTFESKTYSVCNYFEPLPKILNGSKFPEKNIWLEIPIEEGVSFILEDRNGYNYSSSISIVMGGVQYFVDFSQLSNKYSELVSFFRNKIFNYYNPILKVNIGDVDVSASRESLELTTKTYINLYSYLTIAQELLLDKISEEIRDASSYSEACLKFRRRWNTFSFSQIGDLFYHGWKISPSNLQKRLQQKGYACRILEYHPGSNLNIYGSNNKAAEQNCIFILQGRKPYQERIKSYLKSKKFAKISYHYFIYINNDKNLNSFIAENHLNDYEIVFVNDIKLSAKERKERTERKVNPNVLVYKEGSWSCCKVPVETKYYIYLYRSKFYLDAEKTKKISIPHLKKYKKLFKYFLNLEIEDIYGVKKAYKKIDSSWIPIEKIIEKLQNNVLFQEVYQKRYFSLKVKEHINFLLKEEGKITNPDFVELLRLGNKLILPEELLGCFYPNKYYFTENIEVKNRVDKIWDEFIEKRQEVKKKYPILFKYCDDNYTPETIKNDFIKIVNLLGEKK